MHLSEVEIRDAIVALKPGKSPGLDGIPNEFLEPLASSVQFAVNWVARNVSSYITTGVNIRYCFFAFYIYAET